MSDLTQVVIQRGAKNKRQIIEVLHDGSKTHTGLDPFEIVRMGAVQVEKFYNRLNITVDKMREMRGRRQERA